MGKQGIGMKVAAEYISFRRMLNKLLTPMFLGYKNWYMCETKDGVYLTKHAYPEIKDDLPYYDVLIIS